MKNAEPGEYPQLFTPVVIERHSVIGNVKYQTLYKVQTHDFGIYHVGSEGHWSNRLFFLPGLCLADISEINLFFLKPIWIRVMKFIPRMYCIIGS